MELDGEFAGEWQARVFLAIRGLAAAKVAQLADVMEERLGIHDLGAHR